MDCKQRTYDYLANSDNIKANSYGYYVKDDKSGENKLIYLGQFIERTPQGSSNNYYFIYKFEYDSINTDGEYPELKVPLCIVFRLEL